MDFAVPADHRVKLKENEKKDKYLDLAKERKITVEYESDVYTNYKWCSWYSHEGLIIGLEDLEIIGRMETIQTTTLLRLARILRRVLEICCLSDSSKKPSVNADEKNSQRVTIIKNWKL